MKRLVSFGVRQLFGGARRGQPAVAGFGAAIAIVGWLRGRNHSRKLLYKRNLKSGEEVRIRFLRGEVSDETTVRG